MYPLCIYLPNVQRIFDLVLTKIRFSLAVLVLRLGFSQISQGFALDLL